VTEEWIVYDSSKEDFSLVSAGCWREAVVEAAERDGLVPRSHTDVRPRTGTSQAVRDIDEFNSIMDELL